MAGRGSMDPVEEGQPLATGDKSLTAEVCSVGLGLGFDLMALVGTAGTMAQSNSLSLFLWSNMLNGQSRSFSASCYHPSAVSA